MTSQTGKLAELAAPTRGRIKYAPLTAGLLARKGEAVPATPYYAAEALDLYTAGPIVVARHEPAKLSQVAPHATRDHDTTIESLQHRIRSVQPQTWRMRRPALAPEPVHDSKSGAKPEIEAVASPDHKVTTSEPAPTAPKTAQRMALSLDFDLDLIGRLALHAQHTAKSPTQLLEEALRTHLGQTAEVCPLCTRALGQYSS